MAGNNLNIPSIIFFIALTMFICCKAPPPTDPSPVDATASVDPSSTTENATSPSMDFEKLGQNGSINWSNKLDIFGPTDLKLKNLQFNGDGGSLIVYLLKDCAKFDMKICTLALSYKLSKAGKGYQLLIDLHSRQAGEKYTEKATIRRIGSVSNPNVSMDEGTFNVTICLDTDRGIGLRVDGYKWQNANMEGTRKSWASYMYKESMFVQVLTEDNVTVGDWHLGMALRPMQSLNDETLKPGVTASPRYLNNKFTNWTNGDYINLRFKMVGKTDIRMQMVNGYPEWNSGDKTMDFGNLEKGETKDNNSDGGTKVL